MQANILPIVGPPHATPFPEIPKEVSRLSKKESSKRVSSFEIINSFSFTLIIGWLLSFLTTKLHVLEFPALSYTVPITSTPGE